MPPPEDKKSRHRIVTRVHALVDWCAVNLGWLGKLIVWLLNAASVALAGAVVFVDLPPIEDGFAPEHRTTAWLLGGAAACILLSSYLTHLIDGARGRTESELQSEIAEDKAALSEAVVPTLRAISRMVSGDSSNRKLLFERTLSQVMNSRSSIFPDVKGVRMVVYQLMDGANGRPRSLIVTDDQGRKSDRPSKFTDKDRGRGSVVFRWLDSPDRAPRFVKDVSKLTDQEWKGSGRGYRTFISVPIEGAGEVLGMLTVDAPEIGDLRESDIPMLEVMAYAVATAFMLARR